MTSFKQIEANRRNAQRSNGPITEEGKQQSRCNAVRHGLTAETVIGALEDWPWAEVDESWDEPAPVPYINPLRYIGRNDPCPCGSGKKFKNCHLVAE